MALNTAIGDVRVRMKAMGIDERGLVSVMEESRLRLKCKSCLANYVVATQDGGCIVCPCGTAMVQLEESKDRGRYQWLERQWRCKRCDFAESVRFLLEHGLSSLWLEDSITMKMRPMRLLSA